MRDGPDSSRDVVRLEAVTVRAGNAVLLDTASLCFRAGAPTAIVGPNGAGKTTLLRALMGLHEVSEGSLTLTRQRCAIVFQKPAMLRRTAAENVHFALEAAGEPATAEAVLKVLDQVGLTALANRQARKLSGGEQQRLAIARALALRPELLLLDEATASLDPAQTKLIEDLISAIASRGVKIIFATHDLGQARRLAGDVVLLVNGRVAEHAPTTTFFNQPRSQFARKFVAGELILSAADA